MKYYIKNIFAVSLILFVLLLQSCEEDDKETFNDETSSVLAVAKRTTAMTSFLEAVEVSGSDLNTLLADSDNYTVFAPTNAAFNNLLGSLESKGFESLADFDTPAEKELLANLLKYHVAAGANLSSNLNNGQVLLTLQGDAVNVGVADGVVSIADATDGTAIGTSSKVTTGDLVAENGVIHFVDRVLLTQEIIDAVNIQPTLTQLVKFEASLSLLEAAVIIAGLGDVLGGDGPFTVLAPTDDAFMDLLSSLGSDYTSLNDFDNAVEIELLKNILLYHIVPEELGSTDLVAGVLETAFTENDIEVIASGTDFVIGDASSTNATITSTDIMASNGVAHTIDKVLQPQAVGDFLNLLGSQTFTELLASEADFSILNEAVIKTDLVAVFAGLNLDEDGEEKDPNFTYYNPATVFAPNNVAFEDLFDMLGLEYTTIDDFDTEDEIALLKNILLYHVLESEVKSTALSVGDVTTLSGADIEIIQRESSFVIGDKTNDINAVILAADVDVRNGVIHVIDKVLQPIELVVLINP